MVVNDIVLLLKRRLRNHFSLPVAFGQLTLKK